MRRIKKKNREENHFLNILFIFAILLFLFFSVFFVTNGSSVRLLSYAEAKLDEDATSDVDTEATLNTEGAAKTIKDIVYCSPNNEKQRMDLYYPENPKSNPTPLVVYIHGGGWKKGDKTLGAIAIDLPKLMESGFMVAAVNYRLAPTNKFSTFIADTKCAVRFLRAKAFEYGIDPNRIGGWGGSAGAHIGTLVTVTAPRKFVEPNAEYANYSGRFNAFVSYSGFYDLQKEIYTDNMRKIIYEAFGAYPGSGNAVLNRASPVYNLNESEPFILMVHAVKDKVAPISQAREFRKAFRLFSNKVELVEVRNAGHTLEPIGNESMFPSREEIGEKMVWFFNRYL